MIAFVVCSFVVICSFNAVVCQDGHNVTVRPHYDPYEHESFSFIYEGSTHQMLMLTDGKCYVWPLSQQERHQIHTDAGIAAVELRLLKQVNAAYFTKVPRAVLHTQIVAQCSHYNHNKNVVYYLHQMLMLTDGKCYVWPLSQQERHQIHTDAGIAAVELRLLKQVNAAYFTKVPRAVLHTQIVAQCSHYNHNKNVVYYLVH